MLAQDCEEYCFDLENGLFVGSLQRIFSVLLPGEREADSVKNQYEHFLSLLHAHCSMAGAPEATWKQVFDEVLLV